MKIIRVTNPSLAGMPMQEFHEADLVFYRPDRVWWKPWQRPAIYKNAQGDAGKCSFKHLSHIIAASGNTKILVCNTSA